MAAAGRGEQRFPRLLIDRPELPLAAVLALGAAVASVYAVLALLFGWELFIGEGENLSFAHSLAHDGSLYVDWSDRDLLFPAYAPGFYAAVAPLTWIAGHDPWAGRLVSLAAVAVAAFAAARIARRLGCGPGLSLVAGLALFSLPAGSRVLYAARPDGLVLGLSALALLWATAWEDSRQRSDLALAAAASVAVLLTKQNFAPLVLAILVAVWLRERHTAVWFAAVVAAATVVIAALVELLSSGAFTSNLRDFAGTGYSYQAFEGVFRGFVLPFPNPLIAVAAVEAVIRLADWRRARAIAFAWIAGLLVVVSAIKVGSSDNYLLLLSLVSAILAPLGLARLRAAAGGRVAAATAAALALMLAPGAIDAADGIPEAPHEFSDRGSANQRAADAIEARGGSLFGDRADLAVASGRKPAFDAINYSLLARNDRWDPGPVARRIRRAGFDTLQSSTDLLAGPSDWPAELQRAARDRYCEFARFPLDEDGFFAEQGIFSYTGVWLYRPCPASR
jgi:hypothetical protein